jgi:16S rRNA (adenine1518-N6/adenine1519-N6)-dimethyltransferase
MHIHRAKKSMGQNFLKSIPALNMMCEAGSVNDKDTIVEIGPGKGALTSYLLEKSGSVVAIEKDRELIEILEDKFKKEIADKKLVLINDDILTINPKNYGLKDGNYKIIANIPYNITGAILKRFLSEVEKPEKMVLLVQKEVAERIVARDSKESILSLSVKAYGTPKYMMKVAKRFFSPSPKVDSAIIAINDISLKNFKNKKDEEVFFNVIKSGFAHKRKVLRKNLESLGVGREKIDNMFRELNLSPMSRAEDIKLPIWIEITRSLY